MTPNYVGNALDAESLADKIRKFWRGKARVWIEPVKANDGKTVYEVKTNLVNGVPRHVEGVK